MGRVTSAPWRDVSDTGTLAWGGIGTGLPPSLVLGPPLLPGPPSPPNFSAMPKREQPGNLKGPWVLAGSALGLQHSKVALEAAQRVPASARSVRLHILSPFLPLCQGAQTSASGPVSGDFRRRGQPIGASAFRSWRPRGWGRHASHASQKSITQVRRSSAGSSTPACVALAAREREAFTCPVFSECKNQGEGSSCPGLGPPHHPIASLLGYPGTSENPCSAGLCSCSWGTLELGVPGVCSPHLPKCQHLNEASPWCVLIYVPVSFPTLPPPSWEDRPPQPQAAPPSVPSQSSRGRGHTQKLPIKVAVPSSSP